MMKRAKQNYKIGEAVWVVIDASWSSGRIVHKPSIEHGSRYGVALDIGGINFVDRGFIRPR